MATTTSSNKRRLVYRILACFCLVLAGVSVAYGYAHMGLPGAFLFGTGGLLILGAVCRIAFAPGPRTGGQAD